MQFYNFNKITNTCFLCFCVFLIANPVFAQTTMDGIDTIRAEMAITRDKNSPNYIKLQQKLNKEIAKNKINYTEFARFRDVTRLISQMKYKSASYELNELINLGYELSKCNELLGDIAVKEGQSPRVVSRYYKLALQEDRDNISASFKLAKLYLGKHKNLYGIEYLKQVISKTQDITLLEEIKNIIENNITPQNKYEANILYEALGDIYVKLDRKGDAYEAYAKALKTNPRDLYLRYFLVNELYEDRENHIAVSMVNSILQEHPEDTQIKITKAKSLIKLDKIDEAEAVYREILSKNPYSIEAKYGIYQIYKDYEPDYIMAKIYPQKEISKFNTQDYINFSNMLREVEDYNSAEIFQAFGLNIESQAKLAKQEETKILPTKKVDKEKNIKKDIQKNKAIKKDVKKKEAILKAKQDAIKKAQLEKEKQRKIQLQKEQEKKEAIKKAEIKKAEMKKLEANAQAQKKAIEEEQKRAQAKNPQKYQELKAICDKYQKIEPKTAEVYIAIANTHRQMEELNTALQYFKKALKLDPTNSDIYYNMGLTYLELNSEISAKVNLTKSINLDKENEKAKTLLGFVNQKIITKTINEAYAKYEKKKYIDAFEILDRGIKDYPKNAQMHYYRALIYNEMDRNAAAIIDLQKAIDFDPSYYMSYYQLGHIYEKINDERSALVAYERFLSIEPEEKELINEIQKKVIDLGAKYY